MGTRKGRATSEYGSEEWVTVAEGAWLTGWTERQVAILPITHATAEDGAVLILREQLLDFAFVSGQFDWWIVG